MQISNHKVISLHIRVLWFLFFKFNYNLKWQLVEVWSGKLISYVLIPVTKILAGLIFWVAPILWVALDKSSRKNCATRSIGCAKKTEKCKKLTNLMQNLEKKFFCTKNAGRNIQQVVYNKLYFMSKYSDGWNW